MFGRNKDVNPGQGKKTSLKDTMANQLEEMEAGKEMMFRLGSFYTKPFITVQRNPEYPGTGKKYFVHQDGIDAEGNPAGKPGRFWDTDKPKEIADWILNHEGGVYNG